MQQLFTGQTRLPGFHGEWEVKQVAQFGDIVTGGTPRTDVNEFWGEGYPWVTPTDISSSKDMFESERCLTRKGLNAIRALPANTVLVTCIASIGKNAILKTAGGCNQQINAVIPNKMNCAEFLYYLFEANRPYLMSNAGMTATSIISKAVFSELEFRVPPLPEQSAIAAVLSDMDAEIAALEQRREKTSALKHAMMQELLTGKTRLVAAGGARA
jgi:type I restriction enzyme S subunit